MHIILLTIYYYMQGSPGQPAPASQARAARPGPPVSSVTLR